MSEPQNIKSHAGMQPISWRRRIIDHFMTGLAVLTVILVLVPLVAIFGYLVYRGMGSINWAFLTQTPRPVGEPGGGQRDRGGAAAQSADGHQSGVVGVMRSSSRA